MNKEFRMQNEESERGQAGVWARVESVFGAPSRRGNFSLGGAAARALPLPQQCKSLRRKARWALLGFVGPLNLKKFSGDWKVARTGGLESPPYMRTGCDEKIKITKRTHFKNVGIA
ncbi:MAG: hypothetical protein JF609_10410 [Verrucomicrobia bacterium]|nr:hypothetical protein [Verrucomicrobiota bacterium]